MSSETPRTRGLLMMVVAPSGVGKTSLTRRLVADHSDLMLSISATTRQPRPGEHEGRDYHFVDRTEFDAMIGENAFLEWAEVYGNRYGSPRKPIMAALDRGESVLFDIDYQGTQQVRKKAGADTVTIFILPPSMRELRARLERRAEDSADVISKRLDNARHEIERWKMYDYVIVNEDVQRALSEVKAILLAEQMKRARSEKGINDFVAQLLAEERT